MANIKETLIAVYETVYKNSKSKNVNISDRKIELISDTSKFEIDKIKFESKTSTVEGFTEREFKKLFKIFLTEDNILLIKVDNKWCDTDDNTPFYFVSDIIWEMDRAVGDLGLTCKRIYGLEGFTLLIYGIPNSIPLIKFEKAGIGTAMIKKLVLAKKFCRLEAEDYPSAKRLYLDGKVEFLQVFGKDRVPVPNSKELYELINNEHFLSTRTVPMSGGIYKNANIAAVFNYYNSLFNVKICKKLFEMMDTTDKENILKRFNKLFKNNQALYNMLPDNVKLLWEVLKI